MLNSVNVTMDKEPSDTNEGGKSGSSRFEKKGLSPFGMTRHERYHLVLGQKRIADSSLEAARTITSWDESLKPQNPLILKLRELRKADIPPTRISFLNTDAKVATEVVFRDDKTIRVNLDESIEPDASHVGRLEERAAASFVYDAQGLRECRVQADRPTYL